ncbi:MAG: hypothetical protein ACPKPY_03875 [Nitrososphaeraceae archaeon]
MNDFKNICDFDISKLKTPPLKRKILLSNVTYNQYVINEIILSLYLDHYDDQLGEYSVLVLEIKTNKGNVTMKYDEGFRGPNIFDSTVDIIKHFTGFSPLINRALIELQG